LRIWSPLSFVLVLARTAVRVEGGAAVARIAVLALAVGAAPVAGGGGRGRSPGRRLLQAEPAGEPVPRQGPYPDRGLRRPRPFGFHRGGHRDQQQHRQRGGHSPPQRSFRHHTLLRTASAGVSASGGQAMGTFKEIATVSPSLDPIRDFLQSL